MPDVSYGLAQSMQIKSLVGRGTKIRFFVPKDGTISWRSEEFDDEDWIYGSNGLGFEPRVDGFAVRLVKGRTTIEDVTKAEQVLADVRLQELSAD